MQPRCYKNSHDTALPTSAARFLEFFRDRTAMKWCRRRRWCRATIPPCCSPMPAWCSSRTSSPAPRSAPYPRATTAQKCVRAGGKHNDLDNVGYTARHHTFFEMLGNFSFGDYFKEGAIDSPGTCITKDFGLAQGPAAGHRLSDDDEARGAVEEDRRASGRPHHPHRDVDNFWSMGDTGPCGPCSEIFYDHGDSMAGRPAGFSPDEDGDRFVEIWNLVFMQFEQVRRGHAPRPAQALDRHRHGAGAHHRRPAGRAQQLTTSICSAI